MPVNPDQGFAFSEYFTGLAGVISTAQVEVWTRPWDDGLEFKGIPGGGTRTIGIREIDRDCPEGRPLPEYLQGFVYWMVYALGLLREGIVDPPTFAELKGSVREGGEEWCLPHGNLAAFCYECEAAELGIDHQVRTDVPQSA